MKLLNVLVAAAAALAMTACTPKDDVKEAQKDVIETRQEAQKDVSDAQGQAVQDVNSAKETAAKDIQSSEKNLAEEQRDAAKDSQSSTSTSIMDNKKDEVKVTPEQCARFATNKTVKPEDKALYDACSKLNEKSYR